MNDSRLATLREFAAAFRTAIEISRADRLPGALPYFPDGACRLTSRLFAQHLADRPGGVEFCRVEIHSGILPDNEHGARHFWLEVDGAVIDLTADPFGEPPVIIGARTAFHEALKSPVAEDAVSALATLNADETGRLRRQLATIASCLP